MMFVLAGASQPLLVLGGVPGLSDAKYTLVALVWDVPLMMN